MGISDFWNQAKEQVEAVNQRVKAAVPPPPDAPQQAAAQTGASYWSQAKRAVNAANQKIAASPAVQRLVQPGISAAQGLQRALSPNPNSAYAHAQGQPQISTDPRNIAASNAGGRDYTGLPKAAPIPPPPVQMVPQAPPPESKGDVPPPPVAPTTRTIAAHEVDVAGPTLHKAWGSSEEMNNQAIQRVAQRNGDATRMDIDLQHAQQLDARAQEDQIKANANQQAAQNDKAIADFDQSSKDAAKFQVDNDRLWDKKTNAQKAAWHLSNFFSGLGRGATGGNNTHLQRWKEAREDDINAQKTHYEAMRGRVGDQKSLYSMGMEKFGNSNAAMEHARAAHAEAAAADLRGMAARYKGTEQANHADEAYAALAAEKAEHVKQGTRYVQAQTQTTGGDGLTQAQRFQLLHDRINHSYTLDEKAAERGTKGEKEIAESQRNLSKDLEETGAPSFDAAMNQIKTLTAANGGQLPGGGYGERALKWVADREIPIVSGLASWERGTAARQVDQANKQLAEAQAKASGQRGPEAIELNRGIIEGNGSDEDRKAGYARAQAIIDAKRREALAGYDADTIALHNKRKGQ